MASVECRPLTTDDLEQAAALSLVAFGGPPAGSPPAPPAPLLSRGRHRWGAFDGSRLLAHVAVRDVDSWWGGRTLPTAGLASVAVTPERRGEGLLGRLLPVALADARERGAVLSTLYPTAPGIYQPFGYEIVTAWQLVDVPLLGLGRLRADPGVSLRRAEVHDVAAVRHVYDTWAAAQRGPLTRRGPSFPASDAELLAGVTGITVAVDEHDEVLGYVSWDRGEGYDRSGALRVHDLLAVDDRALRPLWAFLGSFSSVVGSVRLRTSGLDAALRHLPGPVATVVESRPYMLRVDDVAAALTAVAPAGEARFAVVGDRLGVQDGTYDVRDAVCRRTDPEPTWGLPTFTPRGLALAYAGTESAASLRLGGHLAGSDTHDGVIDGWWGRGAVHIRDYF